MNSYYYSIDLCIFVLGKQLIMKPGILFSIFLFLANVVSAQSPMIMNDQQTDHIVDRLQILTGINGNIHSSLKYYDLESIAEFGLYINDNVITTENEKRDLRLLLNKYPDWNYFVLDSVDYNKISEFSPKEKKGFLNTFYKSSSSFYKINKKGFFMKVDPVINFKAGKDISSSQNHFQNTRGFKISGLLDKKIYFYTSLFETQRSFLPHIEKRIERDRAIPGQGYYKIYKSSVLKNITGYDFLNAQAYIGFNVTKHLSAQMGHGKFFIGNGIRSLFLSDYSNNYYYLKFDTKVWKFQYRNIYAELASKTREEIGIDTILPKKYMAGHYLSYNISDNFQIGIFENVVFTRNTGFELQYLNPVILYRTVEQFVGGADNVLVGIDWKYNFLKRFSFYGQFLLDEFNLNYLKQGNGWWGNKYGFQMGLKYINLLGIDHLDFQAEHNFIRPYTYSHREKANSYSHYSQPLGHPLGANLEESIVQIIYQPQEKILFKAKFLYAMQGEDKDGFSYGGNILESNENRPLDSDGNVLEDGFFTGIGAKRNITQYSINASYMFFNNYYCDLDIIYRKEKSDLPESNLSEFYFGTGIRVNMWQNFSDY